MDTAINSFGFYLPDEPETNQVDEMDADSWNLVHPVNGCLPNFHIVVLSSPVAHLIHQNTDVSVKYGKIVRPTTKISIGITLFSPRNRQGVRISRIKENSLAAREPILSVGDVILEFNGIPTFSEVDGVRVWMSHKEVVDLVIRAGTNFTLLACTGDSFDLLKPLRIQMHTQTQLAAIEEDGLLRPLPCSEQNSQPSSGFVPSQISSSAKYRQTAKNLHLKYKAGSISGMEYRACLQAALANALIEFDDKSNDVQPSPGGNLDFSLLV